jgi:putative two-component system response regulator
MSQTLEEAERAIGEALKSGSCPDPHLLEARALECICETDHPSRRLKVAVDTAFFLYVTGRSDRGLEIVLQARKVALQYADPIAAAMTLNMVGVCAADTGNIPLAMEAYSDALNLAQNSRDEVRQGKVWLNLGTALAYSGLYREAIGCFYKALMIADSVKALQGFVAGLHTNIAVCHLNLDEPTAGLKAIMLAIENSSEANDAHSIQNRVLAENYFTRLLIEVDDFNEATKHAKAARQYASQSKSPRADITASVAEGLAEVFSGQPDVGISRLTSTLERAKALKVATREVLVAIVKAHERLGLHDKALDYLKQMLAAQRQTQEANVLRHVERHLEQLHAKGDVPIEDSKQAIKRLETRQELLEGRIAKRDLFRQSVEGLERLAVATELRDDSTGEHSYRVGRMASLLAKEAGCDEEIVFMIDIAARLHDIGKIAIPDGILLKPTSFNKSERIIMEMHADAGANVLAKSNIPQIQMAEEIARYHHERWDGEGYPRGLLKEEIPLAARITAIADVFDALTHVRPYKHAWTIEAALTEVQSQRGRHFDPTLTDLFLTLVTRMVNEGIDLDDYLGEAARQSSFHQAKGKIWESLKMAKDEYQAKYARTFDPPK